MVKDFRLELNNNGVYIVPGEVTGTVVVVTDGAKSYKSITVTLRGYADVHWTETVAHTVTSGHGANRTTTSTRHYRSHEDYINDVIILWDHKHAPNKVLNPGQYVLPFCFVISNRFPSSFEGVHGRIRYEIEAKITTGLFRFDKTVTALVKVVNRVDINVPSLMRPVQFEVEKTICYIFCTSPPISLTVKLPRAGFCIGEGIPLIATLDNSSGRTITLRATVRKTVVYRAQGRTRSRVNDLSAFRSPPVRARSTFEWKPAEQIAIASAVPTISNCLIISLDYSLVVEAVIPWATNAVINIPITLGNVPSRHFVSHNPDAQAPTSGPPLEASYPGPPYPVPPSDAPYPEPPHSVPPQWAMYPGLPPDALYLGSPSEAPCSGPLQATNYPSTPPAAHYPDPPPAAPYPDVPPGAPCYAPPPYPDLLPPEPEPDSGLSLETSCCGPPPAAHYPDPPPAEPYTDPPSGAPCSSPPLPPGYPGPPPPAD